MNKYSPILIAGPPRCGTTMLAGVFIKHGVWVGECKSTRLKGTNSALGTENIEIKKYLKDILAPYKTWNVPLPDMDTQDAKVIPIFKKRILGLVNTDGPWLVKTANTLMTWQLWNKAFPNALWVFPKRDPQKIVESARRHPAMRQRGKKIKPFILALIERQGIVSGNVEDGFPLDMDTMVQSKDASNLMHWAGLDYQQKVMDKWIRPKRWHHAK